MLHSNQDSNQRPNTEKEQPFLIGSLWLNIWNDIKIVGTQWRKLLMVGILFAGIGALYTWYKKPVYQATVRFVIEENKQNAGGLFSALAGQVGMDLSSLSGTSGVLAGDNVLELLKSPTLIKKVLLSPHPQDSLHSLAWHYAKANGKLEKMEKLTSKSNLFAPEGKDVSNRTEDSLLFDLVDRMIKKELFVFKPDRKLSIFQLNLTTRNEELSQLISMRLIKRASDFYIDTKTRRLRTNVDRLQRKADSIAALLNSRTATAASKDLINVNPAYVSNAVDLEISNREKGLLGILYGDLNKSLDLTRTALIQETPTIEIIDSPDLPLKKIHTPYLYSMTIAFLIGLVLSGFFYSLGIRKSKSTRNIAA